MKLYLSRLLPVFSILLFISCRTIQVPDYTVTASRAQKTAAASAVRIVQISDFHSNDFGRDETVLIQKIKDEHPDLIAITGDFFDFQMKNGKAIGNVKTLLAGIRGLCPFYYVSGNHEFLKGHNDEYSFLITEYGGTVLDDTAVPLVLPQGTILVSGISDPFLDLNQKQRRKAKDNKEAYRSRLAKTAQKAADIKKTSGNTVLFSVLLAHRPEYIEDYQQYAFDLILSGHAHGGQWRIPGLLNGFYAPMQGFFPKYAGGRYDLKTGTVFIVSRGLSYQRPWFPRILDSPELVIIDVLSYASD